MHMCNIMKMKMKMRNVIHVVYSSSLYCLSIVMAMGRGEFMEETGTLLREGDTGRRFTLDSALSVPTDRSMSTLLGLSPRGVVGEWKQPAPL